MKKINENLLRRFNYEQKQCLYRLAESRELGSEEISGALHMVEDLTRADYNSKDFNAESMRVLGIENCCNFFKAICQQYSDLIINDVVTNSNEQNEIDDSMDIVIGSNSQGVKPRIMNISIFGLAKYVDYVVTENCINLYHGAMKGQEIKQVNQYATFSTIADMYYSIRDYIEGRTYYDGKFMNEYRELPLEYEKDSDALIYSFRQRSKVTATSVAKKQLLATLDEGVEILNNMFDLIDKKTKSDDYYSKLQEDYYKEHGYPQQSEEQQDKVDITSEEYVSELQEAYNEEHRVPESTERHL